MSAVVMQPRLSPYFVMQLGPWSCMCDSSQAMAHMRNEEIVIEDGVAQVVAPSFAAGRVVVQPVLPEYSVTKPARVIGRPLPRKVSIEEAPTPVRSRQISLDESTQRVRSRQVSIDESPEQVRSRQVSVDGAEWADFGEDDQQRLQKFWSMLSQPELCRTSSRPASTSVLRQRIPSINSVHTEYTDDPDDFPDFSGRWLLTSLEGDFDEFLSDIGVGFLLRRMAKSFGYGVGRQVQDISMDDDDVTITTEGGPKVLSMTARIGGGQFESVGLDGEKNFVTLSWQGLSLQTDSCSSDGKQAPPTFRYFQDENTKVVETATSSGAVVKRFFTRQDGGKQPRRKRRIKKSAKGAAAQVVAPRSASIKEEEPRGASSSTSELSADSVCAGQEEEDEGQMNSKPSCAAFGCM